jgi:hypothetical protein
MRFTSVPFGLTSRQVCLLRGMVWLGPFALASDDELVSHVVHARRHPDGVDRAHVGRLRQPFPVFGQARKIRGHDLVFR